MATLRDIAWIAGLVEGEGSFCNRSGSSPQIQLAMTDRDVVARAAHVLGVEMHRPYTPRGKPTYKQVYGLRVCGSRAIGWMQTIWILMGERRRERISQIVRAWRAAPGHSRASHGEIRMASCHPYQRVRARGLCKQCYMLAWRAKRREARPTG